MWFSPNLRAMVPAGMARGSGLIVVIETAVDFGVGFLSAVLLGLLIGPLVFRHAVRRAMRRLASATPYAPAEIQADKDQLRSKLAASTRQLEMSLAAMKTKTMSKLAELGEKTGVIDQLRNEIGEKTDAIARLKSEINDKAAAILALEDGNRTLGERLRVAEAQFEIRGNSLREAEEALVGKDAQLARLGAELGEQSTIAAQQREEIAALRDQVEIIRASIADYEDALNRTVLGLAHGDANGSDSDLAAPRDKLISLGAHRARRS